jgi:Site-specific DNA methylase
MTAYYNEIDPYVAEWLRNLMRAGHIAPGDIDTRSIEDVRPDDLRGYTQCHFFAGIGVWSYALRQAGWPDDRPVWTGSCPCQPFSQAGKGAGFADERHLWPHFHWLIAQCRPPVVFGEQVASKDGLVWLDLVQADLEGTGYTSGAVDTCAAGFGAPHIRQRLYWVAYADDARLEGRRRAEERAAERAIGQGGVAGGVDHANGERRDRQHALLRTEETGRDAGDLPEAPRTGDIGRPRPTNGFWRDADWLFCRDGKWRPVEPGTFPLADGSAGRMGRVRAYGNAIVAPQAAEFIRAFLSCEATTGTGEGGQQ